MGTQHPVRLEGETGRPDLVPGQKSDDVLGLRTGKDVPRQGVLRAQFDAGRAGRRGDPRLEPIDGLGAEVVLR